mmetsp:Transcript_29451/g.29062  ORF Transcript_29451/g.29062 Transcript_29451/m.29062 type:complete len:330 (-) Transcript_29451:41-1030(-)
MKTFAIFFAMLMTFSCVTAANVDVVETIEGVLIGAFADHGVAAVKCIQDGEATFQEIEESVKELSKGGVTNIVNGLSHIGQALEHLPEEFKDCQSAEAILGDFKYLVEEFKNPKQLVVHVGYEILWYGRSIYKDITGAVANFEEGHFKDAGVNVGDIIHILLVQKAVNRPQYTIPTAEVEQLVEGILVGTFGGDAKAAVECLEDGEQIIVDIEKAINEFEQGGVTHVVEGLKFIGEALEELPVELQECEAAEGLFDDFQHIIDEFKNPTELAVHFAKEILWHGKTITKDVKNAQTHFNAKEFEPAGEDIGAIVKILFVDKVTTFIKDQF